MACFSYLIAWLLPSWQASYSHVLHATFMERMLSIFFWFLSLIACILLEIYMVPTGVLTTVPVPPPRPATRTCGGPICMHTPQNLLVPTGTHAPLPSSRRSPPAALARLMRPLVPRYERAPSANQRHTPRASPRAQQMDTAALPRKYFKGPALPARATLSAPTVIMAARAPSGELVLYAGFAQAFCSITLQLQASCMSPKLNARQVRRAWSPWRGLLDRCCAYKLRGPCTAAGSAPRSCPRARRAAAAAEAGLAGLEPPRRRAAVPCEHTPTAFCKASLTAQPPCQACR